MQVTAIFIGRAGEVTVERFGEHEVGLLVDVDRLQRVDLEQDRALADAPPGGDLVGGEQVEVGVLLVHRRQVLGPQQHVGVVVDRRPVGGVQPGLPAGHREQRVVVVERRAPSGRGRRRSSRAAAAGSSCASAGTTPTAPARRRSAAPRSSACDRRAGGRGGRSPRPTGTSSAACSLTVGLSVSMTTLADPLDGEQRRHDAVEQRDAVERAVVLARHPLAGVAHRDEGDDGEAHRPSRDDRSRPVNPFG